MTEIERGKRILPWRGTLWTVAAPWMSPGPSLKVMVDGSLSLVLTSGETIFASEGEPRIEDGARCLLLTREEDVTREVARVWLDESGDVREVDRDMLRSLIAELSRARVRGE